MIELRRSGKPPRRDGKPKRDERPKEFSAGPPRDKKRPEIDPDNPFAALMALKSKD